MNANQPVPQIEDEHDFLTGSSIRLANLEMLVCELLRKNQSLRDELSQLRLRALYKQSEAKGDFTWPSSES
jgi:hypothetical protein